MKQQIGVILLAMLFCTSALSFLCTENVEAQPIIINSESSLDGCLISRNTTYYDAYNPTPPIFPPDTVFYLDPSHPLTDYTMLVGQDHFLGFYHVYYSFASFNTSIIPSTETIISADLNVRLGLIDTVIDFNVRFFNVNYGLTLDDDVDDDWLKSGSYEGDILNTSKVNEYEWVSSPVNINAINRSGLTQYKFNSSRTGIAPATATNEIIVLFSGCSPYLSIQSLTSQNAIITYEIPVENTNPKTINLTYNYTREQINITEGFESGGFTAGGWQTFGSPVVSMSFSPYAGLYHAGASISLSGAGNHTFEKAVDLSDQSNITVRYYKRTRVAGAGTSTLTVDWYNGTAWKQLESISGNNLYSISTWALSSDADDNPNFILRFNITITGTPLLTSGWIDEISIWNENTTYAFFNCYVPESYISEYNETYDIMRYDVYINNAEWTLLEISSENIFFSKHPCINITYVGVSGGIDTYNLTNQSHFNIYYDIWFLRPKYDGTYNYSTTVYPVEIIDWGSKDLYRYEFWSTNQLWINFKAPTPDYVYKSISPYANVTQLDSINYNITSTPEETFFWIWFEVNITFKCNLHIALARELTGKGLPFTDWQIFINNGTWTNETTMNLVINPDIELNIGETYTLSVFDFFPSPNLIANLTFIAQNVTQNEIIYIPIHPLNVKSFNDDYVFFRIWYNAIGSPFNDHVPAGEWLQMEARNGSYMVAITYMTTSQTGNITAFEDTYYFNITINGTYSFNVGVDGIELIYTTVSGMDITLGTITRWITPDMVLIYQNMPDPITSGTRSAPSNFVGEIPFKIHPYLVTEAIVTQNFTDITSANLYSVLPTTGTVETISDYLTIFTSEPTRIMLNYTDTTNFFNVTEYGVYDLTIYDDSDNCTLWANNSISIFRTVIFQQASIFYYDFYQSDQYLETSLTLNNTTPYNWKDAYFFIGIPDNITMDTSTVQIYDQDNDILFTKGLHYQVDTFGFYLRFTDFPSQLARTIKPYFYTIEREFPAYADAVIEILSYQRQWFEVIGDEVWYGSGTWINGESGPYNGEIWIILKNLDDDIDYDSLYVTDGEGNLIDNYDILSTQAGGSTIRVRYDDVGEVGIDEARTYKVYFEYSSYDIAEFPTNMFILASIIILSIIGGMGVIAKKKDQASIGILFMLVLIGVALMFLVAWALNTI